MGRMDDSAHGQVLDFRFKKRRQKVANGNLITLESKLHLV